MPKVNVFSSDILLDRTTLLHATELHRLLWLTPSGNSHLDVFSNYFNTLETSCYRV